MEIIILGIGVLLGIGICSMYSFVFTGKEVSHLKDTLNSIFSQNNVILSTLNNPAINGLLNTISEQKTEEGFHNGLDFSLLSLFKLSDNGGMIVGEFKEFIENYEETTNELLENETERAKLTNDLAEWYKNNSDKS